jgi:hypothetical protein
MDRLPEAPRRRAHRLVRRALLGALVLLGVGGCALVAGVEFDKARLDPEASRRDGGGSACQDGCPAGQLCGPDGCTASCPAPLVVCGADCVDPRTSVAHCGGCGKACPVAANGDPTCTNGTCRVLCNPGFGDCANDPAQTCSALPVWYLDSDNDNWGVPDASVTACLRPAGHAPVIGDCLDTNPAVHPESGASGEPFTRPDGGLSFDYDCNGIEEETSGLPHFPGCTGICDESGLDPNPARAFGPGINEYCGSKQQHTCFYFETSCGEYPFDSGVPNPCK